MLRMKFLRCGRYFEDVSQSCGVWHHTAARWEGGERVAVGLEVPWGWRGAAFGGTGPCTCGKELLGTVL